MLLPVVLGGTHRCCWRQAWRAWSALVICKPLSAYSRRLQPRWQLPRACWTTRGAAPLPHRACGRRRTTLRLHGSQYQHVFRQTDFVTWNTTVVLAEQQRCTWFYRVPRRQPARRTPMGAGNRRGGAQPRPHCMSLKRAGTARSHSNSTIQGYVLSAPCSVRTCSVCAWACPFHRRSTFLCMKTLDGLTQPL